MSHRNIPLEQFQVVEPCTMSWESMQGDQQKRFCNHCNKHVYRTREMSRSDAEALLCNSSERVCAILEHDDAGQVLTLDYAPRRAARRGWWWPLAVIGTAFTTLFTALSCSNRSAPPPTTRMMLGEIAPVSVPRPGGIAPVPTNAPTPTAPLGKIAATTTPSGKP